MRMKRIIRKIVWLVYPKGVSIIIPVYNTARYLSKCLDSVLDILPRNAEVIIINDGSTDESEEIILKYKRAHYNVRYLKQKNQGLANVKNRGIKAARGKYVIFIDSDDYVEKFTYSILYSLAKQEKADIVECDIATVYPDGGIVVRKIQDKEMHNSVLEDSLNNGLMSSSCNKLVKRSLYKGLEFPELHNEDVAVTPVLLVRARRITYVPLTLYYYVQREKSINNTIGEYRFEIFDTTRIAIDRLSDEGTATVEMVEGFLISHQIIAFLYCGIKKIRDKKERRAAIEKYCEKYAECGFARKNKYVKSYLKKYGILELYNCINRKDIDGIDKILESTIL